MSANKHDNGENDPYSLYCLSTVNHFQSIGDGVAASSRCTLFSYTYPLLDEHAVFPKALYRILDYTGAIQCLS